MQILFKSHDDRALELRECGHGADTRRLRRRCTRGAAA